MCAEERRSIKLNVVGINFTGIVRVDCLIKNIPYRKRVGNVVIGFNLCVEQPLFATEEEAINYLDTIK